MKIDIMYESKFGNGKICVEELASILKRFTKKFQPAKEDSKFALMTAYITAKPRAFSIMDNMLNNKGLQRITNGFAAKVKNVKSPRKEGYKEKLKEFAEELMAHL